MNMQSLLAQHRAAIDTAHNNAVKAAQKWERATPRTQTERKLFAARERAEEKFAEALDRCFGMRKP